MKPVRASVVVLSLVLTAWFSGRASAQTNVVFPDPNLEAVIRSALGKPAGDLTSVDLQSLTGLCACNANIANLSGLEWATNLTMLNLGGNFIGDLGALQNLEKLASLFLYNNQVKNVSPLNGLKNLSYLVLSHNPITNFNTSLAGFTNLTSLYLGGNSISNVTVLQSLNRLAFLGLENNQVSDFSPLRVLPNLRALDVSYNPLTNFAQLGAFSNLTSLYLSGVGISNLTALSTLRGLTSLTLYRNFIRDLSPLTGLTNLTELGLNWNPLTNHGSVLPGCTNLTRLDLAGNSISDLSFIESLTRLKSLSLRNNRLADLSTLAGFTNLISIDMDYNYLTDITSLQNLTYLSRAGLVGNLLDLSTNSTSMAVIQDLQSRQVNVSYVPQNQPPGLSLPPVWAIAADGTSSIQFQVYDDMTPDDQLLVTAFTSNTDLIGIEGISVTGTNSNRTLTLAPAAHRTGTATITVMVVDDAGLTNASTMAVTVMVSQPVVIPDTNLYEAIRSELGLSTSELTSVDLLALTSLHAVNTNIADLSGLEWATNLATLYLNGNSISDLSVLPALPNLTFFSLNNNSVADFSSLAGLANVTGLRLDGDAISNLDFLRDMWQLTSLSLQTNLITNVSPLAWLTNLAFLSLQQNLLTDIGHFPEFSQSSYINLSLNLLDVSPNSSAWTVVDSLQARGVTVDYLPQRGPPNISVLANWVIAANATSWLGFSVEDDGPFPDQVIVTASSADANLMSDANLAVNHIEGTYWALTGTPTSGGTGTATITLTATDDLGFSHSVTVQVTVVNPLPLDGALFNSTGFTWQTGGNAAWFGQTISSHDGISAAQSGSIGDNQESWLETTVTGPGTLSFWWRVSSETGYDWLKFYLDGVPQLNSISGESGWQQQAVNIPSGTHALRWRYSKDAAVATGLDAAWLDQVTFVPASAVTPPLSWLELIGRPTNGQCQLMIHGVTGKLYEVQISTNLVNWFFLGAVVPTNSAMPFLDTAAKFRAAFYRLHELPASSIWLEMSGRPTNGSVPLVLHSPPGMRFEMQASTNLVNWSALAMITNSTGTVAYSGAQATNSPRRFYRAAVVP